VLYNKSLGFVVQQIHNKRGDASDGDVAALVVLVTSPITTWRVLWANLLNSYTELSECCTKQKHNAGEFAYFVSHRRDFSE